MPGKFRQKIVISCKQTLQQVPDVHTPEQRHRNMAAIHSASTKPELKLRKALWRLGFRYRTNDNNLPGKPDIVLPKYRTAIFVHGCFWHGHKECPYYVVPKTKTEFWQTKVLKNQERDQEVWRQLEAKGWSVIIVWECQLKNTKYQETIEAVSGEIRQNGEQLRKELENRNAIREIYRRERKVQKDREETFMKERIIARKGVSLRLNTKTNEEQETADH